MPRSKNKREYSFKPLFKEFAPTCKKPQGSITLNHDEIEAIFLMDNQNLYQDDAAKRMNVSRPTFSRIVKSARFKIATALVSGKKIIINDEKETFTVMVCCAQKGNFSAVTPRERYIAIITFGSDKETQITYLDNPVYTENSKPGIELPPLAQKHEVNFFVSDSAGAGLVNSLLSLGIFTIVKDAGFNLEELIKTVTSYKV